MQGKQFLGELQQSLENPWADLACIRPPIKWKGITAQATRAILQLTIILTMVAIRMEEMHWTMTDILSDIMVLIMEVSVTICEVRNPTLFSGFSNQAISLRSTPGRIKMLSCYTGAQNK